MFCGHCGAKLDDDAKFCGACGQRQVDDITEGTVIAEETTAVMKEKASPVTVLKRLLVIAMACFIFPFVTVSCAGESISISGIEAMTGATWDGGLAVSDYGPNLFLLVAFLLAVAALIVVCKKIHSKIPSIFAALGFVLLILSRVCFRSYYGVTDVAMAYVSFRWGWLLALLFYALSTAVGYMVWKDISWNELNRLSKSKINYVKVEVKRSEAKPDKPVDTVSELYDTEKEMSTECFARNAENSSKTE